MSRNIKICILSEYAYSLITGENTKVGGAELQMTILAKELIKKSYDVSFVTFGKSSSSFETIGNIKVYSPFNIKNKGYTYFYPQNIYKLLKTLNKIDADVYIQRAGSHLTGILAFFAGLKNKIFIFSASSDANVSTALDISTIRDLKKIFFYFGVKFSTYVVCQSEHQKKLLRRSIGRDGRVIRNAYLPPKINQSNINNSNAILWVGRIIKEKRPELFLKLAKENPDIKFWMIGNTLDPEYYNKIKKTASRIKNLEFIGSVPHDKIDRYYAESSMLVNTSPNEGFPNTFVEAWGNYIPVVSLDFDPDEVICRYGLGFHSKNFDDLVKKTYMLLKNKSLRTKMGIEGRKYVEKEHNVGKVIDGYEKIFNKLKLKENTSSTG